MSDPEVFDHQMVDDQIRACENALILEKQPVSIKYSNLGETLNSRFSENNPVISGDESTIVYSAQLQFYPAVFYSFKQNGSWTAPLNINPDLGVDDDCFPVGISYDGKELLLYRNNEYLGDLYVSRLVNGKWTKIKRLNSNINTKFWESHACFSRDGKRLYFTSNRKDSHGGLDIYVSVRTDISQDNWGAARNLGPEINSPLNEETPFITANESKIYFSSLGHNGMGGYDIFVSEAGKDGNWGKPINIGYPLNTTDHDLFFQPVRDGNEGYIALSRNDSYGRNDIYKVTVSAPESQLASINRKLKEPETTAPSSGITKDLLKQDTKKDLKNEAEFVNSLTDKAEPALASLTPEKENSEPKTAEVTTTSSNTLTTEKTDIQTTSANNSDTDSNLSAGQKKAWHKLLYGGLGILAVFAFFILLLLRKSRKKDDKQNL
jgi:Tol biopolymer transport system component